MGVFFFTSDHFCMLNACYFSELKRNGKSFHAQSWSEKDLQWFFSGSRWNLNVPAIWNWLGLVSLLWCEKSIGKTIVKFQFEKLTPASVIFVLNFPDALCAFRSFSPGRCEKLITKFSMTFLKNQNCWEFNRRNNLKRVAFLQVSFPFIIPFFVAQIFPYC